MVTDPCDFRLTVPALTLATDELLEDQLAEEVTSFDDTMLPSA